MTSSIERSASGARRRKVSAVLAGGLVLGVGAAVTLAAWNDSEFATGTFAAGSFNLEGSVDGTTFSDHDDADSAAVVFNTADHQNLSPGETVYEPFWLRLSETSTSAATVELEGVTGTGGENVPYLSYSIFEVDAECSATGVADAVEVGSGATLGEAVSAQAISLAAGSGENPGEAAQLCFAVTAAEGLLEGESAATTWQLLATSID